MPPNGPVSSECIVANYSLLPIFDNGYWTFKRSTANFTGNYTVSLFNTGQTNNSGFGWSVAKSDLLSNVNLSTSWRLQGNCVIASTASNTRRSGMNPPPGTDSTSFNHNYATVQSLIPLPVELLYFNAVPLGEDVVCTWSTASETNNDYFEVERSLDGKEFTVIGTERGYGNGVSTETRYYKIIDHELCEGIRYYRLKQFDTDGHVAYSEAVAVNCSRNKDFISLYPNPAQSIISCSFYETNDGSVKLQWLDALGKVIREDIHDVIKGFNTIQSDVSEVTEGIYFIRIRQNGKLFETVDRQIKFLKN